MKIPRKTIEVYILIAKVFHFNNVIIVIKEKEPKKKRTARVVFYINFVYNFCIQIDCCFKVCIEKPFSFRFVVDAYYKWFYMRI